MLRIATWNVNGLRARLDFVLHWLRSRQPDVVGMQELKAEDRDFPRAEFEALGYQVAIAGQKGWNGVAIASRLPMAVESTGLPGQESMGARLIRARIRSDAGSGGPTEISYATVYCPNGKDVDHADFPRKLDWFDALADYVASVDAKEPLLLGGDFNIVPTAIDTWRGAAGDGGIFCTTEERARYQALLDAGLVDLYRDTHPDQQQFSWWDYRGGAFHRGMGLRIDMLLGRSALASKVREVVIDREYRKKQDGLTASDHAPVYAELDL